jgi:hypothetical protein
MFHKRSLRRGDDRRRPTFGKISKARFPTGEAGSSRQIQLAVRFSY